MVFDEFSCGVVIDGVEKFVGFESFFFVGLNVFDDDVVYKIIIFVFDFCCNSVEFDGDFGVGEEMVCYCFVGV